MNTSRFDQARRAALFRPSAEMTIGPFFPPRYCDATANDLTTCQGVRAQGEPIEITGRVVQVDGAPTHNLVIEIWQADSCGIYDDPLDPRNAQADPGFFGWGRCPTDADGRYRFQTIRPGAMTEAGMERPARQPHINLVILFSGVMRQLHTVMYFPESDNDLDPVYCAVPAARRALLVAQATHAGRYRFDIRLRGEGETPFFAP